MFGDLKIVREEHQAYVKDQKVRLTKTEYAILKLFLQNPRQVLTKSVILDRIQQETPDCVGKLSEGACQQSEEEIKRSRSERLYRGSLGNWL